MKKKIFEYFDNSTEVNKAVLDGLLDEIIAKTAEEAYADMMGMMKAMMMVLRKATSMVTIVLIRK